MSINPEIIYNRFIRQLLNLNYGLRENVVVSPVAAMNQLCLLADSLEGPAKDSILDFISPALSHPDVHAVVKDLTDTLCGNGALSVVDSLKIAPASEGLLKPEYQKILDSRGVKYIPEGGDLTREGVSASFVNTATFDMRWERASRSVYPSNFRNANVTQSDLLFGIHEEELYIRYNQFDGFLKGFDGDYTFMALQPHRPDPQFAAERLRNIDFPDMCRHAVEQRVRVSLPFFSMDVSNDIKTILTHAGVKNFFADCDALSPMSSSYLEIDSIVHRVRVHFGLDSAAACEIRTGVDDGSVKKLYFLKPFVFAVIHNETLLPVIAGVANVI